MGSSSKSQVLGKGGVCVGKGYVCDGMFKLTINNINNVYAYICDSFSSWHNRLGHVNFRRMNDMVRLGLIPYTNKGDDKCKIYMLTKLVDNPFHLFKEVQISLT